MQAQQRLGSCAASTYTLSYYLVSYIGRFQAGQHLKRAATEPQKKIAVGNTSSEIYYQLPIIRGTAT